MQNNKKYITVFVVLLVSVMLLTFLGIYMNNLAGSIVEKTIASNSEIKVLKYYDDNMIVGTRLYTIYCMDEQYNKKWSFETKGEIITVDTLNNNLYVASSERKVYVLNMVDGTKINEFEVGKPPVDMTVDSKGNVLVSGSFSSMKNTLYYLNNQGEQLWKMDLDYQAFSVLHNDESFYIGLGDGSIHAVDMSGSIIRSGRQNYAAVDMIFDHADKSLVTISKEGWVYKIDSELKVNKSYKPKLLQGSQLISLSLDTDTNRYAAGSSHGELVILDENLKELYKNSDNYIRPVWSTAFSQDGSRLAVSRSIGGIEVLDAKSMYLAKAFKMIKMIAFILLPLTIFAAIIAFITIFPKKRKFLLKLLKEIFKARVAYFILVPSFTLLAIFNYFPIIQGLSRAFTDWSNLSTKIRWIGFDNFRMMFEEGFFFVGIKNVAILLIAAYIKILTIPLLIAELIFNLKKDKAKYAYRFLFMLPMIVPGIVGALLWKTGIFDPDIGALNTFLGAIGLDGLKQNWLANEKIAIWSIVFTGFPFASIFHILIYYGGLINISPDLFEAAKIDGCSRFKAFFKIDIPMISSQIKLVLILAFISAVQDFGGVYFLTAGGPGISTYVPGLELFYNATKFGRYGYASAMGLFMFIFILGATILQLRVKSSAEKM